MKRKLLLTCTIILITQLNAHSEVNWKAENIILKGKVLNFQNHKKYSVVTFIFKDIIKRELQTTFTRELDSLGRFELQVSTLYPQDFYMIYGNLANFICSPGDSLIFEIDASILDHPDNEYPNGVFFARVISGNRVKDNADLREFLKERPDKYFRGEYYYQALKNKSAAEYSFFIQERENTYNKFLAEFKKLNATTVFFNQWAEDYLKYESLADLIDYPRKHDSSDRVQREEIIVPAGYYDFLKDYHMDDYRVISTKHANLLNLYYQYSIKNPKDNFDQAWKLFQNKDIIGGAKILLGMIKHSSSGFTRNLMLTKFYLDAIEGQQLKEFEALYDPSSINDAYFKRIIITAHENLKKYMSNQSTEGASLKTIENRIVKNLIDTISSKYSGKVVYIDFWAPWCAPCMVEMPYSRNCRKCIKIRILCFCFLLIGVRMTHGKQQLPIKN